MKHSFKKVTGLLALFLVIAVSATLTTPRETLAAGGGSNSSYTLLEPLPCVNGTAADTQTPNCVNGKVSVFEVDYYIKYAFRLAIALAAFAAVVMFTYGGFEYMMSETSVTNQKTAKDRMKNAVLGLLAVLSSYVILNTIDPRLVNVTTTIPPLKLNNTASINFGDLTDQLAQQARVVLQQVTDANKKIADYDAKIASLYGQLDSATSTEEQDRIQLEIEEELNKKDSIRANIALTVGKTLINQLVNKRQNSVDEVNKIKSKIMDTYVAQQKEIVEAGHQELLVSLTDMKNYALALTDINMDLASLKDKGEESKCKAQADKLMAPIIQAKIASLNSKLSQADSIADPDLKAKLQEAHRQTAASIRNYKVPYSDCNDY